MLNWEQVDGNTFRARVFGGWLVKSVNDVYMYRYKDSYVPEIGYEFRESITFVPDPNGEWTLEG